MFIHWHSPLFVWPLACFLPLPSLYTQVFGQKSRTYADFWPKVAYTRRFYTKILFSTQVFGQKSRIWAFPCGFLAKSRVYVPFHAGFWPKVTYIRSCSLYSHVHPPFWWFWCCGKLLGGLWVWLGLPWFWCCLLDASFVTRDRIFIDFSLKVVLVIYHFGFSFSALLFFVSVSCRACVLYLLQRLGVLYDFYCIFHSFILKNTR